jgi:hypothetical protein
MAERNLIVRGRAGDRRGGSNLRLEGGRASRSVAVDVGNDALEQAVQQALRSARPRPDVAGLSETEVFGGCGGYAVPILMLGPLRDGEVEARSSGSTGRGRD